MDKIAAPVDQMALKREAVNRLLKIFGTTFGGMAAIRGIAHLASPYPAHDAYLSHPTTTTLPIKVPVRRPKVDAFDQTMAKGAGFGEDVGKNLNSVIDVIKQKALAARDALAGHLPDISTTNPLMNSFGMPAAVATGMAGAYGGLRTADAVASRRQRSVVQDSLNSAKAEYEQELRRQFANRIKSGAAKPSQDAPAKEATLADVTGALSGTLALALGIPAAISMYGGFNLGRGSTQPKALQKAIEIRRRALQGQGSGLYAIADNEALAGTETKE